MAMFVDFCPPHRTITPPPPSPTLLIAQILYQLVRPACCPFFVIRNVMWSHIGHVWYPASGNCAAQDTVSAPPPHSQNWGCCSGPQLFALRVALKDSPQRPMRVPSVLAKVAHSSTIFLGVPNFASFSHWAPPNPCLCNKHKFNSQCTSSVS